jgi:hypothetical protein
VIKGCGKTFKYVLQLNREERKVRCWQDQGRQWKTWLEGIPLRRWILP